MLFCLIFHEVDNSDFISNVSKILDEFYSVQKFIFIFPQWMPAKLMTFSASAKLMSKC